jgi:hypothetical protein
MSDEEKTVDYLESQIPSLSASALDLAYRKALASGQEVLISDIGGIFQVFPDGNRKLVKPTPMPLSVPVGTRVLIP